MHRILFKNGILGIENVGGDLDKVTGRRCTFAFFPWNWDRGDGCIIRLVAIVDPKGKYRIEKRREVQMIVEEVFRSEGIRRAEPSRLHDACACSAPRPAARKALIAGVSHFLPGGGAGPDASPPEKVYFVLAGELTVIVGGKETVLKAER